MLTDSPKRPSYDKVINTILMDLKITNHLMAGTKEIDTSILVLSSILYEADLQEIMRKSMIQMMLAMLAYTPFNAAWSRDAGHDAETMMDAFIGLRQKSVKNFLVHLLTAVPQDVLKSEALHTVITRNVLIIALGSNKIEIDFLSQSK